MKRLPANKCRQLQIRVSDPVMDALDDLVVKERAKRPGLGITRVSLIREAITKFLVQHGYTTEELGED